VRKNKSLITIFFIVFIGLFGFGIIMPLLPYIAESFGASPLQIGLLATTYSLFQFIASPILGALSDRYGRKKNLNNLPDWNNNRFYFTGNSKFAYFDFHISNYRRSYRRKHLDRSGLHC